MNYSFPAAFKLNHYFNIFIWFRDKNNITKQWNIRHVYLNDRMLVLKECEIYFRFLSM